MKREYIKRFIAIALLICGISITTVYADVTQEDLDNAKEQIENLQNQVDKVEKELDKYNDKKESLVYVPPGE